MEVVSLWNDLLDCSLPTDDEDFIDWLAGILKGNSVVTKLSSIAMWWCIWKERNEVVWNQKTWSKVKMDVLRLVHDWQQLEAKNGPSRCLNDAHLAEAVVIKEALSWVKEKGLYKSDGFFFYCQSVCNLINSHQVDIYIN
ncbi:PREDICTED: uncharacterized protein LOC109154846 [Ipomoea nil]|uniref:uncharacterized protein LOC109154846 n=1 Tax=Ipomoea nil TaxID=35883 RepID=UPI000901F923|nr:PREDICTED: uncharacterized protein LOC109154846 [Ipomoea nil]